MKAEIEGTVEFNVTSVVSENEVVWRPNSEQAQHECAQVSESAHMRGHDLLKAKQWAERSWELRSRGMILSGLGSTSQLFAWWGSSSEAWFSSSYLDCTSAGKSWVAWYNRSEGQRRAHRKRWTSRVGRLPWTSGKIHRWQMTMFHSPPGYQRSHRFWKVAVLNSRVTMWCNRAFDLPCCTTNGAHFPNEYTWLFFLNKAFVNRFFKQQRKEDAFHRFFFTHPAV